MKRNTFKMFVSLLVIWALSSFTYAQVSEAQCHHNGHLKRQLDAYFDNLTEQKIFSGSVLIAKEGKILLKKGYGKANYETGKPNKPETVFAIASMSKAFTAMSIMILEERGLLSVNDTVDQYIPGYPNGDNITIHQLLRMTVGIPNFLVYIWDEIDQFHTPEELLQSFINEPTEFEPGTQYSYCNSCYILLGLIIEKTSGMCYRDFVTENIFKPLGMKHTFYDPYDMEMLNKRAIGYDDISVDPPVLSGYLHASNAYSAGGIFSTVTDMYKWDQALYTEQLVSFETLERIFAPGIGEFGWTYAYGWIIKTLEINGESHWRVYHEGGYLGFHSIISRLVDDKITFIILANISDPAPYDPDPCADMRLFVEQSAAIIFAADNK
jgi:CubicO group peptidase (beta-lactamase class C family)